MSSKFLLTAGAVAAAILLSAGLLYQGQPPVSASQADEDPFGAAPPPAAADNPLGPAEDQPDPFSVKPKETKTSSRPDPDDPLAAEPSEPAAKAAPEPIEPPAEPAVEPAAGPAGDDPFAAQPAKPEATEAKGPTPTPARQLATGEEAIEKALGRPAHLEFHETPLQDVVDYLKHFYTIEIFVDNRALADVGLGGDTLLTVNLKNISLRSALDLILQQHDLTWTISSDVLLITTQEQANAMWITKVYDVADLVTFRDQTGELWEDYDLLTKSITTTISPASWDARGRAATITGGTFGTAKVLAVSQSYRIHRRIAEFLQQLRSVAAKQPGDGQPPRRTRHPQPFGGFGGMGMGGMGAAGMGGMGGGGGQGGMGGGFF